MFEYFIGHVLLSKLEGKSNYDTNLILRAGQAQKRGTELTWDAQSLWLDPNSGSGRQLSTHTVGDVLWLCRPLGKPGKILALWLGAFFSSRWGSATVLSRLLLGEICLPGPTGQIFLDGVQWDSERTWPWFSCQGEELPVAQAPDNNGQCLWTLAQCQPLARGISYLVLFCDSFVWQIFIKCQQCSRHWGYCSEQTGKKKTNHVLMGLIF